MYHLQPSDEAYPGTLEKEIDFLSIIHLADKEQLLLVQKAIRLIKNFHGPVKRKLGESFCLHFIAVAKIVTSYTQDINTILAALLHDTVEDTPYNLISN